MFRTRAVCATLAASALCAGALAAPITVGCIGDSITAGNCATAPADTYPAVLQVILGAGYEGECMRPRGPTSLCAAWAGIADFRRHPPPQ
jgi:hypothetical protein